MSRIRSIHPGQWTDDQFVSCSVMARLFSLAIRNFADDHGVFEWAPLKLKMLCLPGDNCDGDTLLAELVASNQVYRYDIGARAFGLIRNFSRFQRPQKPKYLYPTPPHYESAPIPETTAPVSVADEYDSGTGKSPQRKEVGGRREEKEPSAVRSESTARAPRAPPPSAGYAFWGAIIRLKPEDFNRWKASYSAIPDLVAELETIDAKLSDERFEGKWFGRVSAWLQSKHDRLSRQNGSAGEAPMSELEHWRIRLTAFTDAARGGPVRDRWRDVAWGPAPGEPGCLVPPLLISEFHLAGASG